MKTLFGLESPEQNWQQMHRALLLGNSLTYHRQGVMKILQGLFNSCYAFGINPLPALRKAFPRMCWKYWRQEGMGFFGSALEAKIAADASFVWRVSVDVVIAARATDSTDGIFFIDAKTKQVQRVWREDFSVDHVSNL